MDSAIISALISAAVGVVSVAFAHKTAVRTVEAELAKLKATWEHEQAVTNDKDFENMLAAVTLFSRNDSPDYYTDAVTATSIVRAHATGNVATAVDELSSLLVRHACNGAEIRATLEKVLQEKKNS